jgi:hypothetical protein
MANKRVSQQLLTLEHRLERQSDTIKNIQENVVANFFAVAALTLASSSYFFAFFECVLVTANTLSD